MNDFFQQGYKCLCTQKICALCQQDWDLYFVTAKYIWESYQKICPTVMYESPHTRRRWCYGIADDLEQLIKKHKASQPLYKLLKKVDRVTEQTISSVLGELSHV